MLFSILYVAESGASSEDFKIKLPRKRKRGEKSRQRGNNKKRKINKPIAPRIVSKFSRVLPNGERTDPYPTELQAAIILNGRSLQYGSLPNPEIQCFSIDDAVEVLVRDCWVPGTIKKVVNQTKFTFIYAVKIRDFPFSRTKPLLCTIDTIRFPTQMHSTTEESCSDSSETNLDVPEAQIRLMNEKRKNQRRQSKGLSQPRRKRRPKKPVNRASMRKRSSVPPARRASPQPEPAAKYAYSPMRASMFHGVHLDELRGWFGQFWFDGTRYNTRFFRTSIEAAQAVNELCQDLGQGMINKNVFCTARGKLVVKHKKPRVQFKGVSYEKQSGKFKGKLSLNRKNYDVGKFFNPVNTARAINIKCLFVGVALRFPELGVELEPDISLTDPSLPRELEAFNPHKPGKSREKRMKVVVLTGASINKPTPIPMPKLEHVPTEEAVDFEIPKETISSSTTEGKHDDTLVNWETFSMLVSDEE